MDTTSSPQSLAFFAREFGHLDHASFLAQFDCPFLVENAHANGGRVDTGGQTFRTDYVDAADTATKLLAAEDREVWPIRKRGDSAFSGHIGVGRTPNLDICIARTGVSKFHAYFSQREGVFQLTDKESTNGTFVAGMRLDPGMAMSLREGVKVEFATYVFTFISPLRFHRMLQSLI